MTQYYDKMSSCGGKFQLSHDPSIPILVFILSSIFYLSLAILLPELTKRLEPQVVRQGFDIQIVQTDQDVADLAILAGHLKGYQLRGYTEVISTGKRELVLVRMPA